MKCNFEVDNFELVSENSNSQFATIKCDIARSGKNTHRMNITRSAISASVSSVAGKPILAAFNSTKDQFLGHEDSEIPVGFFEDDARVVEKDNELYIRATGKIWKRYFSNVMEIFKKKGSRTDVSMEAEVLKGTEPTLNKDGSIDLFSLLGCTLLGVKPAIKGAEATVLSFSEMLDEYNKESKTDLEKFSESRIEVMSKAYKVNTSELKDTPWEDVSKTELRNKVIEATNKSELVKRVYALVEDGWQTAPSEHLKYPIMQLVGDTFYYNKGALSSALAYAKQENEQSVINKVMELYKKFKLDMEDEMAEKEKKDMSAEIIEAEEKEKSEEVEEKEEKLEETETPETMSDDEEKVDDEDDKEDVKDGEGDDEEAEEFSDEVTFAKALTQLMDCGNDEERMACRETMSYSEDENIVMDRVCAGCKELAELRKFKADTLDKECKCGVAEVLASVKQSLSQEDFAALEEKSNEVNFESLETFKVQAKAFAFEHMIKPVESEKEDDIIKMGVPQADEKSKNVFERILGK